MHPNISLQTAIRAALFAGTAGLCQPFARASADTPADGPALAEVTVTATRREESVLDIPYSISAVSSADLEQNHVQSLSDLTRMIAGISFVDQGPASRSNFVLRGMNANSTDHPSTNTVAPVSTYIGETPLFLSLHIDDLDRVEVLRGPQGTLYGSGSLAGTIRFIPRKPDTRELSASFEGDVADVTASDSYNRSFNGAVNVPLSEIAALRVSAGYQHYAGFINENYIVRLGPKGTANNSPVGIPVSGDPANPVFGPMVFSPQRQVNTADLWQARAAFLIKPVEGLQVLLTFYHQDDQTHGVQAISPYFGGSIDTPPADNPFYSPGYPVSFPTGGVVFPHNGTYDTNDSFLLKNRRQADLGSVDLSFDLGFASLSSSTSYYKDRGHDNSDGTGYITRIPQFYGFIPRMVDYEIDHDENKGLVEEVRLVSNPGKLFDYVAGLFYQHIQGTGGQTQWIPGQTYFGTLAGVPGANPDTEGDVNYIVASRTDFLDRAAFGELTWHITDSWQLTGGARFFKQNFATSSYNALPYCGSPYCGDGPLGVTNSVNGYSVNDHIFKLNSSYKWSSALTAYLNYSEGFRRGGANAIPIDGPFAVNPALTVYTPDKAKNYEIGAKGTRFGINYTVDYFYIDWDNFQLDTQSALGGFPIAVNGPKARSRGVELSFDGELLPKLTYQVGYSYTNAQVARDFSVEDLGATGPVAIVTGRSGDPLPNSPKHSATLALNYTHAMPLLSGWDIRWHVDASYRSSTMSQLASTDPTVPPPFRIKGFEIWNGSVDFSHGAGFYTRLYAENIFNQLAVTGGADAGEVGVRAEHYYVGRPRTVGVRVGYKF
jgi:iron complex outermembrane receptor protein